MPGPMPLPALLLRFGPASAAAIGVAPGAGAGGPVTIPPGDLPRVGDEIVRRLAAPAAGETVDVAAVTAMPASGATWDLTGILPLVPETEVRTWLEPDAGPCADLFAGADAVVRSETTADPTRTEWTWIRDVPGTGRLALGECLDSGGPPSVGELEPDALRLPEDLGLGTVWSQDYVAIVDGVPAAFSEINVVDGWGTIILPQLGPLACLRVDRQTVITFGDLIFAARELQWIAPDHGVVLEIAAPLAAGTTTPPPDDFPEAARLAVAVEAALAPDGIPGDVDGDGSVGLADLLAILVAWGPCPGDPCPSDLDGDGLTGFADLVTVLTGYD